jgi:hypothetical protein
METVSEDQSQVRLSKDTSLNQSICSGMQEIKCFMCNRYILKSEAGAHANACVKTLEGLNKRSMEFSKSKSP